MCRVILCTLFCKQSCRCCMRHMLPVQMTCLYTSLGHRLCHTSLLQCLRGILHWPGQALAIQMLIMQAQQLRLTTHQAYLRLMGRGESGLEVECRCRAPKQARWMMS